MEPIPGSPPGTTYEWWAQQRELPGRVGRHPGPQRARRRDRHRRRRHPPGPSGPHRRRRRPGPRRPEDGPAGTDTAGHGTHVASLACAADSNGIGLAGAGLGCRLIVEKTDLTDSSVAASIIDADEPRRAGDQHELRHRPGRASRAQGRSSTPSTTPTRTTSCWSPRPPTRRSPSRATRPTSCSRPTPARTSPRASGSTSPRPTSPTHRAIVRRAGHPDLDRRLRRLRCPERRPAPGCSARSRRSTTLLDTGSAGPPAQPDVQLPHDASTATSATRSFRARRWPRRRSPRRRRSCARSTPGLRAADTINLLKQTATRPAGVGWTDDLGWGILNAGAALEQAKSIDRTPPVSKLTVAKPTSTKVTLRWTGSDVPPPGRRLDRRRQVRGLPLDQRRPGAPVPHDDEALDEGHAPAGQEVHLLHAGYRQRGQPRARAQAPRRDAAPTGAAHVARPRAATRGASQDGAPAPLVDEPSPASASSCAISSRTPSAMTSTSGSAS